MRIYKKDTPQKKLASDIAEIIELLGITPHGVPKAPPFEAHMGRKPNPLLSNFATIKSPKKLNYENTKHA